MNKKTNTVKGEGTLLKVNLDLFQGKFTAENIISLYEQDGKLLVYVNGQGTFRIPLKEVEG